MILACMPVDDVFNAGHFCGFSGLKQYSHEKEQILFGQYMVYMVKIISNASGELPGTLFMAEISFIVTHLMTLDHRPISL